MYTDKIIHGGISHREALKTLIGEPVGYSVARTMKILEIKRQSVYDAINRDALHATRIYIQTPKGQKLISTEVDRESVHSFLRARMGRTRSPFGYKDDQLGLFT